MRVNEDTIGNPSPRVFDLDANLLRSNLPLFLFMVESLDRQYGVTEEAASAWRRKREIEDQGRRGTDRYYSPAHTGHVRYLRAGVSFSKFYSLNSNPLLYHFLIQKHVCP